MVMLDMIPQVRSALELPEAFEWTVQGFGMIRTYLDEDKRYRLNVWHEALKVANVSTIHDHPWSFKSHIFAGELKNTIYDIEKRGLPPTHFFNTIRTGEDGGLIGGPLTVRAVTLRARPSAFYFPGDQYGQRYSIIHETDYMNGTVTLNDRTRVITEDHSARVFFPYEDGAGKWVDAKPRPATAAEIARAIKAARTIWRLNA